MDTKNKSSAGFTLIELLVVISIIGLLASVVLVSLTSSRAKARDAKRVGEMNQFSKAMELFFNERFSYPTTTGVAAGTFGILSGSATPCSSGTAGCINYVIPNTLVRMPVAPLPADNPSGSTECTGAYNGATGNDYQFAGTGAGVNTINNYTVTFCLGRQSGSLGPGVHTLTRGGFQ